MNTNEMNCDVALEIVRASDIEPKEVKWLWYPYIPFGKVTLLQGDPGDGKSKLMLSIAALLSKGEPLPFSDEEEREPIIIIYQTTEDDADDTVVPRFNSAGGNGDNLIFIKEDIKSLSFGDIVRLIGDLPRVELFARQKEDGWDAWGNEVVSDLRIECYYDSGGGDENVR